MSSAENLEILLNARSRFIYADLGVAEFTDLVIEYTDADTPSRQEWTKHVSHLSEVWYRAHSKQEVANWPPPPGASASEALPSINDALNGFKENAAILAQRQLAESSHDETGAIRNEKSIRTARKQASGGMGQSGRKHDELTDKLVIEKQEEGGKNGARTVVYCIGCDRRSVGRDPKRIRDHAYQCTALIKKYPDLYEEVAARLSNKSHSALLEAGNVKELPRVRTQKQNTHTPDNTTSATPQQSDDDPTPSASISTTPHGPIDGYVGPMSKPRQAKLDLLLFKLFVCTALPFALLGNQFFIDFVLALAWNYTIPDRSAFFTRHLPQELAVVTDKLKMFLSGKIHLTLSFDGWSSRAKDEIYTFHTTTPSRRSIFTTGHVFKGVSVTGLAIIGVATQIFETYNARAYGAVSGDGGPNVRSAKKGITAKWPWILNIYDPCHNLNLYLKDLGKLFKEDLVVVSGLSNYFGKSNYGTHQLKAERERRNIGMGMQSTSETRFSSTYKQALAVQTCMDAIKACVHAKTIEFTTKATKKLQPYVTDTAAHYKFMANLSALVQLLSSGANAIKTLEGQNTTCADVFYVWVCIAWHLERLFANDETGLRTFRSKVIGIYNHRFNQMMTESSHNLFLLAFFLHPVFRSRGGLQLTMPVLRQGQTLQPAQYPTLFKTLVRSSLLILHGEQKRVERGGKEESDRLVQQLILYAYGLPPFHQPPLHMSEKILDYWKGLEKDSNAEQLARVAVKLASISPSEICDERTASRLGWFNAARRSSMTPEHLIGCTRLYDYYVNGFTEGSYTHTARVQVTDIFPSSSAAPQQFSAPSLMDLLNEENIAPTEVDLDVLEETLFNHPDPYDLGETDRLDAEVATDADAGPFVVRSQDRWAIAEYIKLDSTLLAAIINPDTTPSTNSSGSSATASAPAIPAGRPEDWSIDDYLV